MYTFRFLRIFLLFFSLLALTTFDDTFTNVAFLSYCTLELPSYMLGWQASYLHTVSRYVFLVSTLDLKLYSLCRTMLKNDILVFHLARR